MTFQLNLDLIDDKIEFFEAESIKILEEKIQSLYTSRIPVSL